MTNDAVLTQLGYSVTESSLAQIAKVIDNTNGYEYISKHIITLHDHLQPHLSFVALSSTKDYFKIKNEAREPHIAKEVNSIIKNWADKFKVKIEKVQGKETYYVLGFNK